MGLRDKLRRGNMGVSALSLLISQESYNYLGSAFIVTNKEHELLEFGNVILRMTSLPRIFPGRQTHPHFDIKASQHLSLSAVCVQNELLIQPEEVLSTMASLSATAHTLDVAKEAVHRIVTHLEVSLHS